MRADRWFGRIVRGVIPLRTVWLYLVVTLVLLAAVSWQISRVTQTQADKHALELASVLHDSSVAGCFRGNQLRRSLNVNARGLQVSVIALRRFLREAETARRAAYARSGQVTDLRAAQGYAAQYEVLSSRVHPITFKDVDCDTAYPPPKGL